MLGMSNSAERSELIYRLYEATSQDFRDIRVVEIEKKKLAGWCLLRPRFWHNALTMFPLRSAGVEALPRTQASASCVLDPNTLKLSTQ